MNPRRLSRSKQGPIPCTIMAREATVRGHKAPTMKEFGVHGRPGEENGWRRARVHGPVSRGETLGCNGERTSVRSPRPGQRGAAGRPAGQGRHAGRQARLRSGNLRLLHGDDRRRPEVVLPDACRPSSRRRHHHRRRPLGRRTSRPHPDVFRYARWFSMWFLHARICYVFIFNV